MKVLVTGATGFVGRHVVHALLAEGHQVVAVARNEDKARAMPWFAQVKFIPADIHATIDNPVSRFDSPEAVIHLAWPGLPNYHALFHFENNLPADYSFLRSLVKGGVQQILVTGTCFEYGEQSGAMGESMPTSPANAYAIAKNTLHQFLTALAREHPFALQWARLFYMHGTGQSERSLMAQLNAAIDRGDPVFPMSRGEQLRDYLPVERAAEKLVNLLECREFHGVANICSGTPISVRKLVEDHIRSRGSKIEPNLGAIPYAKHEPFAFWGDSRLLDNLIEKRRRHGH